MNSSIRISGMASLSARQAEKLTYIHGILMAKGFPYHSVSVVFQPNDGFRCYFSGSVRDKVTTEITNILKKEGVSYIINSST
jgi:hypothetical protein